MRKLIFSSVQFSRSVVSNSLWPHEWQQPGLPVHHQLLEFTQTHVHQVGDAIQPSHPLSSPSPPAPNASQHQGLFQWINSLHEVAKVLEFQLQIFKIDWLDLLVVQGTLKSLLQHHSSKASILWCSAFLTVQLSHQYMTTGKTRALTRRLWLTRYSTRVKWYLFHTVITADIQDEYYWTKTLNTSPKNAWWVAESEFISDIIHCMILCFIHHVVLRI